MKASLCFAKTHFPISNPVSIAHLSRYMPNMYQKVFLYPLYPSLLSSCKTLTYFWWIIVQSRVFLYVLKHVWRTSLRIITVAHGAWCISNSKDYRKMLSYKYCISCWRSRESPFITVRVLQKKLTKTSEIVVSAKRNATSNRWLTIWLPSVHRIHVAKAQFLMI